MSKTYLSPHDAVPLSLWVPRKLRDDLRKAADEAGERRDHAIIKRLQSSLSADQAVWMGRRT